MPWNDEADEDWIEDEGDDEDDVLTCPSCRESVHEDTQKCPHCGDWITPVYPGVAMKKKVWLIVAVLLILALTLITVT